MLKENEMHNILANLIYHIPKNLVVIPRDDTSDLIADYLIENGVIAFPCKIGDVVYKLEFTPCSWGQLYPDQPQCDGCPGPCNLKCEIKPKIVPSNDFIFDHFISERIGNKDKYFLTYEEAEKAKRELERLSKVNIL